MKRKIFAVLFFAAFILISCSDDKKSKVVLFQYGGHYDTSCAILEGEVYRPNPQPNSKDSLLPLSNVTVQAFDSAYRLYKTTITGLDGKFNMSFFNNGTYSLKLLKVGYQTIDVTNYVVDTGQTSTVKIILEKDNSIF
jgi:Carboxypeptidase regulatory-like domain